MAQSQLLVEKDLTGAALDGFNETMRWFDKGLAAGSPFAGLRKERMTKFIQGDRVRILSHPKDEFCGAEGEIVDIHIVPKAQSGAVTPSTGFPRLGQKVQYDVQIESHPYHVTYLEEEWLESLPALE